MSVPTRGRPSSSTGTGRVKVCSHSTCESTTWPNLAEVGVEFIRFPKTCLNYRNSLPDSDFRKQHNECHECDHAAHWVQRCGRRDKGLNSIDHITPQTYICSKHFSSVIAAKSLEEDPHRASKGPMKGKSLLRHVVEDTKEEVSQNIVIDCEPFPIGIPRKIFVGPWKTPEGIAVKNRPRFMKPWKCVDQDSLMEDGSFAEECRLDNSIKSENEMQDVTCDPADENDLYEMSSLCTVVGDPETETSELQFKALADFFLDVGWTVELAKNKITLLKRRDWSIVISITITALSLEVYVFGKVVHLPDYIRSMALTQDNIKLVIDIIKNYPICKGVDDPELVKIQKDSDDVEGLYCDSSNCYRSVECSGLIFDNYERNLCLNCKRCTEMLSAELENSKVNICVMKSGTEGVKD